MESDLIQHKSLNYIIGECEKRGVNYKPLFRNVLELEYNGQKEIIVDILSAKTSAVAYCLCKEKDAAKHFLRNSGLLTPPGASFERNEYDKALEYLTKENFDCVIKPNSGLGGDLVFTDVSSEFEFCEVWKSIAGKYERILIEKKVAGDEYRFLVTKDKVLSITKRVPAYVEGDGVTTIEKLIEIKNQHATSERRKKIVCDSPMLSFLSKQNLTLDSVAEKGKKIFLRQNSNTSTGGESISYAKHIDSTLSNIAIQAINAIPGLEWAGVDIMTDNINSSENYNIIEINASPGINIHQNPNVGEKLNVAADILDIIFPDTKL